jgi:hypothetical protein
VSTFAVFSLEGKVLGEGKDESEAIYKARDTLIASDCAYNWVQVRVIEYIRGDQDSTVIWIHPFDNGIHVTGQT